MEIAPMTRRDKILLYVVLMLAFVVLFVRFLLIPGIENHQQADADLREAQDAQTSMQDAIMLAVSGKAQRGDVEAARFLRDTVGEKPADGLVVGAVDAEALAQFDLSQLSNEQLARLAMAAGDG